MNAGVYPSDLGFSATPSATHTSRTIMLCDAERLFSSTQTESAYKQLAAAIVEDNVLQRASLEGRQRALRMLRELYGLNTRLPVYRGLRWLWDVSDSGEHGLLAIMSAAARDQVLRVSAETILSVPIGQKVEKASMERHLRLALPGRYSDDVVARTTRNLLSSWTQSGHLSGRSYKVRVRASCGSASACYAVLLGYLQGVRGQGLLHSQWTGFLDANIPQVESLVKEAWHRGFLSYNRSGDVTEIVFADSVTGRVG
ncbi:MAG: hypothetical protein IT209_04350 [Armatimonadetes bacterium]|nr:hypothetical protein [Armatimonadota bacterium]